MTRVEAGGFIASTVQQRLWTRKDWHMEPNYGKAEVWPSNLLIAHLMRDMGGQDHRIAGIRASGIWAQVQMKLPMATC